MGRRKKSHKTRNIVLGITIPLVILLITLSTLFMVRQTIYGGASLIVSKGSASVGDSNNLYKDVFFVDATINGAGDHIAIDWDKDYLDEQLEDKSYIVDNPVFGDINILSQQMLFSHSFTSPIYTVSYKRFKTLYICDSAYCNRAGVDNVFLAQSGYSPDSITGKFCYCFTKEEYGQVAEFKDGERNFEIEFSIDGLQPAVITEKTRVVNMNNKIYVTWTGNTLGQYQLTKPSYDWFEPASEKPRMVQDGTLRTIEDKFDSTFTDAGSIIKESSTPSAFENAVSDYNNKVERLTKDLTNNYKDVNLQTIQSITTSGDKFIMDIKPMAVSFPTFKMEIDAEWVGIHSICTEPEILCAETRYEVDKYNPLNIKLSVDNKGESGYVDMSIDCDAGIEGSVTSKLKIDKDDSSTTDVTITANTNKDMIANCVVKASTSNPKCSSEDTCTINLDITAYVCTTGQRVCDDENLKVCENGKWTITECTYGCGTVDGKSDCQRLPDCKEKGETCDENKDCCSGLICEEGECITGNGDECGCWIKNPLGGCIMPDLWCRTNQWMTSKVILAGMLLGVLTFLIALFVIPSLAEKYNVKNQNKAIPFFIALIIGAITFALVLWLWWVALIVIFILILIKLFFKR